MWPTTVAILGSLRSEVPVRLEMRAIRVGTHKHPDDDAKMLPVHVVCGCGCVFVAYI